MNSSKKIASKMEIEFIFSEKHIVHRKKLFDENVHNETIWSAEKSLRIDYCLYIVDKAISLIKNRLEQFQIDIFGFLFNFTKLKSLDDDSLQKYCLKLEYFLKHDGYYDIDGLDLFSELKVLKEILQIKEYTLIDILNYIKMFDTFPNTCITYRILLIILVTVASAEKKFSKLKLINHI